MSSVIHKLYITQRYLSSIWSNMTSDPFTRSVSVNVNGDAKKWVQNPFTLQHSIATKTNTNADALCE